MRLRPFKLTIVALLLCNCCVFGQGASNPRGSVVKGQVLDLSDDTPVERVRVELRLATGDSVQSTYTRHNGEFEFTNVVNGSYVLVVEEKGYEPVRESVDLGSAQRQGMTLFLRRNLQSSANTSSDPVSVHELALAGKTRSQFRKGLDELYKDKDPDGSVSYFRRTVAEAPTFYEAHYHLGIALMKLGREEESEQELRACIAGLGDDAFSKAHFALASVLSTRNQFAEAEALARKGIALDAGPWQGHYELARALLGLQRSQEAEASLQAAIARRPDYAPSYLMLANMYIRSRNYPALVRALDEFLRLEPDGPNSQGARQTRETILKQMARESQQANPPR